MVNLTASSGINMRLDKYLSEQLVDYSRSQIQAMIQDGKVMIDGRKEKSSYRLQGSEAIVVDPIQSQLYPITIEPQDIPLSIVYEDDSIIVIDKQSGLVVHPGTGQKDNTLVNGLMFYTSALSDINGLTRPGIVHRLDRDTSGLMVIAKTNLAHRKIAEQFENKQVKKTYIGLTWGIWTENEGLIDEPIKRKRSDPTSFNVDETGRKSTTGYKVERAWRYISKVQFYPKTGRTHQIRVHADYMGHPIVADQKYGGGENRTKGFLPEVTKELGQVLTILERHALHAMGLEFVHPGTAKTVSLQAPLPDNINRAIKLLNKKYG